MLPSAKIKHKDVNGAFNQYVRNTFDKKNNYNCKVYSDLDWIINDETVVKPDCMIVCGEFTTDFLTFPPTLILEIASPSTWMKDRNIKLKLYEANNVEYYLLANPDKKILKSFELKDGVYQSKEDGYNYELTVDCNIEIDPDKLLRFSS